MLTIIFCLDVTKEDNVFFVVFEFVIGVELPLIIK